MAAERLGKPFMPWQRYVADIALEIEPDGQPAYREVRLTVPRQSGKTTLILGVEVHRAVSPSWGGPQTIKYAAQTGVDARNKFIDEHVPILEASPFKRSFRVRRTNGHEAVLWRNGSRMGLGANTEKSGHGSTLDLGFVDEAFSQVDSRLEQAYKPAMLTRPRAQLYVVSTAGTDSSTYLKGKVTSGRALAAAGKRSGVAYFEWSAPDDADPADPATWRLCMPALGHTITEAVVAADYESMTSSPGGLAEFRRAYLNQWVDRDVTEQVIPADVWEALGDEHSVPDGPIALAVDITPARSAASIGLAGRRTDGLPHVEVIDARPGIGWVVERLVQLDIDHNPVAIVIDAKGPASSLIPELDRAGVEILKTGAEDMAQACGSFFDKAMDDGLRHRGEPVLVEALAGADKRPIGDGGWGWSRKQSSSDISPLVAVTLALHGYASRPPDGEVEPWVFFED